MTKKNDSTITSKVTSKTNKATAKLPNKDCDDSEIDIEPVKINNNDKKSKPKSDKKTSNTTVKPSTKSKNDQDGSDQDGSDDDDSNKKQPTKTKTTKKITKSKSKKDDIESLDDDDDDDDDDGDNNKKEKESSTLVDVNKIIKRDVKKNTKGSYILVIVESPGKIKKLESILGAQYHVVSSFGHIMDLHSKKLCVDFENNYEPEYHIITGERKFQDKRKVVKDLIKAASKASKVIIAADHDREGEMIGWSYKVVLGLSDNDYERITFNSITKDEVKRAISNPGKLDMLMVDSQKARRILDRLVGFKISPGLAMILGIRNLSAGRVQSIVVRLICEKEQEINKFFDGDNASFFKVNGNFTTDDPFSKNLIEMKCELFTELKNKDNDNDDDDEKNDENNEDKNNEQNDDEDNDNDGNNESSKLVKAKIPSFKKAEKLMQNISKSTFKISDISVRKSKRYPPPPFTTSTAQQDASTKLNFSVKQTMISLQKLYEGGYTTYLRTDSTILSKDALQQCATYIKENYGDDYHTLKNYTNKKGNTQEAHEAIRPVDLNKRTVPLGGKIEACEQKMYDLVWKRTIASQMSAAEVDVYNIEISISLEKNYFFKTSIEDITFPGYLAAYNIGVHGHPFDSPDKKNLKVSVPKKNQVCNAIDVKCSEEYKKPPLRYSEAGLVKKMDPKNLNIGRPATYAEVINTVQKRNYVEIKNVDGLEKPSKILTWIPEKSDEIKLENKTVHLGRENKKFCPTQLGIEVNTILMRNFPELMEYQFTAGMEVELDDIAEGNKNWVDCIDKFWKKLDPLLQRLDGEKKAKRVLGKNPETGFEVFASMGSYGPMLTMGRSEKKADNATAPIKSPHTLETITLKQALKILKYPKILGVHNKKNVELKKGIYGFFVTCENNKASIPEETDPDTVTLEMALTLLEEKQKQHEEKMSSHLYYHKEGSIEYIINKGKYGEDNKYFLIRDMSKKTPKATFLPFPFGEGIEGITFEHVKELVAEAKKRKNNRNTATKGTKNKSDENKPKKSKSTSKATKTPSKTTKAPRKSNTTKKTIKKDN